MPIAYFPAIAKTDYPAFLDLPGNDFPDTHAKWGSYSDQECKNHGEGGIEIVHVYAEGFARFCAATRCKHSTNSLRNYTGRIGLGKHDWS